MWRITKKGLIWAMFSRIQNFTCEGGELLMARLVVREWGRYDNPHERSVSNVKLLITKLSLIRQMLQHFYHKVPSLCLVFPLCLAPPTFYVPDSPKREEDGYIFFVICSYDMQWTKKDISSTLDIFYNFCTFCNTNMEKCLWRKNSLILFF